MSFSHIVVVYLLPSGKFTVIVFIVMLIFYYSLLFAGYSPDTICYAM